MNGERLIWLWVAAIALLVIVAEMLLVEGGAIKALLVVASLGLIGLAYYKVKGDGKTLQSLKPRRKRRSGG